MSSTEFDIIYKEAFISGTGRRFDDADVKDEYIEFKDRVSDEILGAWTNPTDSYLQFFDSKIHTGSNNTLIDHPLISEFDETRLNMAVRVRFLGRSLINVAKHSLESNPFLYSNNTTDKEEIFSSTTNNLCAIEWYLAHPSERRDNDGPSEQDIASPLRLADWPKGKLLNCLGISIATAALCELQDTEYMYVNEIRTSQGLINSQHDELKKSFEKIVPNYYSDSATLSIFNNLNYINFEVHGVSENYRDILFDTPDVLLMDFITPRDFHHFILCRIGKNLDWFQTDPFGLTYAYFDSSDNLNEKITELKSSGNPSKVLLHESSSYINDSYVRLHKSIEIIKRNNLKFDKLFNKKNGLHKSVNFMNELYEFQESVVVDALSELYPTNSEEAIESLTNYARSLHYSLWLATIQSIKDDDLFNLNDKNPLPEIHKRRDENSLEKNIKDNNIIKDYLYKSEKEILKSLQQDTVKLDAFLHYAKLIPISAVNQVYRHVLEVFKVRDHGVANITAEIAEPEFMIGAMYMNHYATWRKDGKINVARHLAQISASQLIWQASMQDGEQDENVIALNSIISDLKTKQLHPLVNVASRTIPRESRNQSAKA